MTDLAEFLLARIADDMAAACDAAAAGTVAPYTPTPEPVGERWEAAGGYVRPVDQEDGLWDDEGAASLDMAPPVAAHIARWDPARVLAECDAKRQIVRAWREATRAVDTSSDEHSARVLAYGLGLAVRIHAAAHADHPDYQQEWKP